MTLERRAFEALGSTCELFAIGASASALAAGEEWLRGMQSMLTRFEPASELSRLNARAGDWVEVSEPLGALLRESLHAYDLSGGLVNVAVLPRMLAIGYTRTFAAGPTVREMPPPEPIPPLPLVLELREREARLAKGTGVDLGGIAKGWLADPLSERLGENSVANLGGDLRARGRGPDGDGWPVGVGDRTVLLEDAGAATSGTERRRWGLLHHLIDPRTGLPAHTDIVEASVIARTATEAEVLAKAALLSGAAAA